MVKTAKEQNSGNQTAARVKVQPKKSNEVVYNLLAVLTAVLIIIAVFGGAFYAVVHNNINGLGEKYRKDIQNIPVLKLALPSVPDPEDPKYLTDDEIKTKYNELRKKRDELVKNLEDANKKILELQNTQNQKDPLKAENEKTKKDTESQVQQVEQQKKQNELDKAALEQLAAKGDIAGFKQFYEKLDKDSAQKIYEDLIKQEKVDAGAKKFAQIFETMDASAAAKIFEQLGTSNMSLIVDIMKNMKKESSSEVLAAMSSDFAAKVSQKLSEVYLKPAAK